MTRHRMSVVTSDLVQSKFRLIMIPIPKIVTMTSWRRSDLPPVATSRHEAFVMSRRDNDVKLSTLFNGVTGTWDGTANLEIIPSLGAFLEIEEWSVDRNTHSQ